MKRGLKVEFLKEGARLLPTEEVRGSLSSVQNALVNIGTMQGTDKAFSDRGTDLFKTVLSRGLPNVGDARHAANFAAVNTLFFVREQEEQTTDDSISRLQLTPSSLSLEKAEFDAYIETIGGEVFGRLETTLLNAGL